jgi:ATP-binding cassette subfamily F protein uup
MNLITGRLEPDSGTVDIGPTIHFGYFDQHSDDLNINPNQRVIDYLKEVAELVKTADGQIITASQMLEKFLFPPNQQYAPIHKLSGGERRRLFLLRILIAAPNVLILDEPTNDLDVQTLGVLEEYLEDFNGCVIIVSHDRYFLDRTVDTIFAFEEGGKLRQYPGNYSVYLETKKSELEANKISEVKTKIKSAPVQVTVNQATEVKPRKLSFKEKKEYESLETKIAELEQEKASIEQQLYQSVPQNFDSLQQLTVRLGELTQAVDQATERWLELAERL